MTKSWSGVSRLLALMTGVAAVASALPAAAQEGSEAEREKEKLATQVSFRCTSDGRLLEVTSYFAALHWDSIEGPESGDGAGKPGSLRANAVVFVAEKGGKYLPLKLLPAGGGSPAAYEVDCDEDGKSKISPADFPTLVISSNTEEDLESLAEALKKKAEAAEEKLDPKPLAFHGDASKAATITAEQRKGGVTIGALLRTYVGANADPALLSGFNGEARIGSLEPVDEKDGKTVDIRRIGHRPRVADDMPEPGNDVAPVPAFAPPAALPASPATQATEIEEAPGRIERRTVKVKLAGKALAALDLASPGALSTFGYCEGVKPGGAPGVFALEGCIVNSAGKIPAKIKSLEPFVIEAASAKGDAPIVLDRLLKTSSYAVPYPVDWRMAAARTAQVPGGELVKVLEQRVSLKQWGLAACEAAAAPSLADVLAETLSFPEPPCLAVDVTLPKALLGPVPPKVMEGCRPGSSQAIDAVDGKVRCALTRKEAKSGKKSLKLAWAPGFDPLLLELALQPDNGAALELAADSLSQALRVSPIGEPSARGARDVPAYKAVEVVYRAGKQPCGEPQKLAQDGGMPSIAAAGCKRLPDGVDLILEIDAKATDASIPLEAFEPRVRHAIDLTAKGGAVPFDASRARRKLPVAFSPERQQRYTQQYSNATDLLVKGAQIFTDPGCAQPFPERAVELFAKRSEASGYQWPVWARVSDNDGQPLTNCAQATIEKGEGGAYLTFDFVSTRAVGPRRVIVMARSQDLMNKPGIPKVLDAALTRFLRAAEQAYKQGAPLSPIDVLLVSEDGTMRRIFTGEQMVLEPKSVQASLASLDRTGPKTLDLSLLRLQPETKDAERVIVIMDGSVTTSRNASEVRLLGSDIAARKNGSLQFFLSSDSCVLWSPHAPQLKCTDLGALPQGQREQSLLAEFTSFLNTAEPAAPTAEKAPEKGPEKARP